MIPNPEPTHGGTCQECGATLANHEAVATHLTWHMALHIQIQEALSQAKRANAWNQVIGR